MNTKRLYKCLEKNPVKNKKLSLIKAPNFFFTEKILHTKINEKQTDQNNKNLGNKEDMSEDLNRLGNDWKSDPNQQEEAKVSKEEFYHPEKEKDEEIEKPEDIYTG
jgi:hypothetical protein